MLDVSTIPALPFGFPFLPGIPFPPYSLWVSALFSNFWAVGGF
jgi:hypothetical protein